VEKAETMKLPVAFCPSCGMTTADSPHASSVQCIHALEEEMRRLSDLLERVRQQSRLPRGA
jgi:hypothetical protein